MNPFYMEWLPASSIKDWPQMHGRAMLLAVPGQDEACVGYYSKGEFRGDCEGNIAGHHNPTHFMPLPPLPNAKQ